VDGACCLQRGITFPFGSRLIFVFLPHPFRYGRIGLPLSSYKIIESRTSITVKALAGLIYLPPTFKLEIDSFNSPNTILPPENARQTLCRHPSAKDLFLRPFTGQDELYFYRCYHTRIRCNILFRPKGFALITHISGKRKRHIPKKRKNYIIRSSEAEDSYLSSDLGKTGVVGSREGKNVALLGVTFV